MVKLNYFTIVTVITLVLTSCNGDRTATPQPSNTLRLTKTASTQTYSAAGQIITYTFIITNPGTTPLGPTQFVIADSKLGAPFACGAANTILSSNQSVSCARDYTTTSVDMGTATITNSATASGAGQSSPAATAVITNLVYATPVLDITVPPTLTGTVSTAERITFDPGSTTASRIGVIDPNERMQYVVAAMQGQMMTVTLTAPPDEVFLGVTNPNGLALKSPDSLYTWNTEITTTGDYTISLASPTGNTSKSYTLTVTLTNPTTPNP